MSHNRNCDKIVFMSKKRFFYALSFVASFIFIMILLTSNKCYGDQCDVENIIIENNLSMINPDQTIEQAKKGEIFILDVREIFEYENGHITHAINIPLGDISLKAKNILPKNLPIYTYCNSGNRSAQAKIMLNNMGYENVINLGGIVDWQEKGGALAH